MRYSFEFRERYDGYSEELAAVSAAPAETERRTSGGQENVCTVVSGDTLWGIAQRYGVALEKLLRANPGIKNPNLIRVGDRVVIPC